MATRKQPPKRLPKSSQLKTFKFDRALAKTELASFETWLSAKGFFAEVADAVPQFDARKHFSAAIGWTLGERLFNPDRFDFELSLGGNYFPDIVVGDSKEKSLVLIELEGALKHQIFHVKKPGEQYPDFSTDFRQGFFQLLDWVHRLKDFSAKTMVDTFTFEPKHIRTVLVVGRNSELIGGSGIPATETQGWRRLDSLASSLLPGNNKLFVYTYDELVPNISARLSSP